MRSAEEAMRAVRRQQRLVVDRDTPLARSMEDALMPPSSDGGSQGVRRRRMQDILLRND